MITHEIIDVIKKLHKNGIIKIEIDYSGGNDEGSFDNPVFYNESGTVPVIDWTKILNLSEDDNFDDDHFTALIHYDEGRLNQWYSFAGEYSCNGTITINTETGEFEDSGQETTYQDQSNNGNIYKDSKVDIFGKAV